MYMYNVHVGEQNNESDKSHYNDYILYNVHVHNVHNVHVHVHIVYMLNVTKCAKRDFTHKTSLTVAILPFITGSQWKWQ